MRRKVDELEAKTSILSIERTELKNKVMNSEITTTYLTNTQKELEAALVEKENHINQMKEIVATSGPDQMVAIKELLQRKEAELEQIKTKFQDNKKPDTEVSGNVVLGTNSDNAASDTVGLENSANSGDTIPAPTEEHQSYNTTASESNHQEDGIVVNPDTVIFEEKANSSDSIPAPAEELHSYNTTASESNHQDERIMEGTNSEDVTPDTVVLDEKANPSGSIPPQAEELQSYNTTASESNHQEDSSSEEKFIKFTTNFEDDMLQEKRGDADQEDLDPPPNDASQEKTGDANQEDSDAPPKGTHLEEFELHHLADSQEVSKEELDDTRKLEDPQGEVSNHSSESKLLEKEDDKDFGREPEKEINPDGELKISKDSLSEANQEIMQVAEPVAVPADVNRSMPTNNDETKETSRRHRKRKSRSKRRKRTGVVASNVNGEVIKER
jgi:hypothetical protein